MSGQIIDCRYCHGAHNIQVCPKLAAKKRFQEQQEQEKQVSVAFAELAAKPNSWASIATKGRSEAVVQKINKEHEEQKKRDEEKTKRDAELRQQRQADEKERREKMYITAMEKQFGLSKYEAIGYESIDYITAGHFWYFRVEGKKQFDSEIAKQLREDTQNQFIFEKYLQEKYFDNWLSESEHTEDDCNFLYRLRMTEEQRQFDREQAEEEKTRRFIEENQKERKEMAQKLKSGQITRQEYNDWKYECEMEDDYAMESSSFDWYNHSMIDGRRKADWNARKSAREAAVKEAKEADELKQRIVKRR